MKIDCEKCVKCGSCVKYCPLGAIKLDEDCAVIDQARCVDCGDCIRTETCPVDAFIYEAQPFPRSVREAFSNPLAEHKETRVPGRGTEEMKTNDIRGLFGKGIIGMACEVGRPGVSCSFKDVDIVTRALAEGGMEFAEENPVTKNMVNKKTGEMSKDIMNERVMSAICEGTVPIEKLANCIKLATEAAKKIDSVYSLEFIDRPEADRSVPMQKVLDEAGIKYYRNGKFNLGLARPLAQ